MEAETTITVRVPERLARRFNAAHEQERRKWELLIRLELEALAYNRVRSFSEIMAEIGSQADNLGLTDADLEALLAEPDNAGCA